MSVCATMRISTITSQVLQNLPLTSVDFLGKFIRSFAYADQKIT